MKTKWRIIPRCQPPSQLTPHYPSKSIKPSVRELVYKNLKEVCEEIKKRFNYLEKLVIGPILFEKLIEEAMRFWVLWKEQVITFTPSPNFDELFANLKTLAPDHSTASPRDREKMIKISMNIHPLIIEGFKLAVLMYEGKAIYGWALDEAILLLISHKNAWIETFILDESTYSRRPLKTFPIEKL